ncbi:class D sortase [Niallia sp. 01092]|uniref:class D sortase n=1 Tax=unclassified Niallia TaxID=2837522 RepID=UPI003FD3299B
MRKWIGFILLLAGISFVAVSGNQIWNQQKAQKQSAEKAKLVTAQIKPIEKEFKPKKSEVFGKLVIPKIDADLPIIEGTDAEELEKGVGHYITTAFPGERDQILLSGHRDTVFRRFDELKLGDRLVVEMPYGKYEYEIKKTKIVHADDTTIIRSTAPDEVLTLSTCYPFRYIGDAPDRFIFYAYPVKQVSVR